MLPQSASVDVAFALPSTQFHVRMSGTVVWAHASGRAGVKLTRVHRDDQQLLEDWVDGMFCAETRCE